MKYPKFIDNNSTIGVITPSAGAFKETKKNKFKNAKKVLESYGYNIVMSKNIFTCVKGRSNTAKARAREVEEYFNNSNIDLILCATGGDFLLEILPYIDFNIIKSNPKWISGFSDPTGLLYTITTKLDIATIYGQNFSPFGMEKLHKTQIDFLNMINGKLISYDSFDKYEDSYTEEVTGLEYYNLNKKVSWKVLKGDSAKFKGRIIGGCFDLISNLIGTKYDGGVDFTLKYKDDGIIWYFDNCELSLEEVIRVLWKMNEIGYFKYATGIIFGRFGVVNSYYGYDVKSCLLDSVLNSLDIPVIYDADISHKSPSMNIINGAIAFVKCKNNKGTIKFELR